MANARELTPKSVENVISEDDFQKLLAVLGEVKYGTVTLFIQDGKVVQIDKLEKIRFRQKEA
ncbi:MAG: YezD family protein [Oscillospiraceae bacterium]|nr:YezD family protein [Oscillospiraceae bacterium]